MEKILNIEECEFDEFIGYKITTTSQEILIGISDGGQCCENYGYLTSEDDFSDFIGSELTKIESIDTSLNVKVVEYLNNQNIDMDSCMFFNLYTTNGMLQFVVYNEHNGYYSHDAVFISNQITEKRSL